MCVCVCVPLLFCGVLNTLCSLSRSSGVSVETKPELQRVLESRKRDQLIKQRKQEEEARRKISPLEAELLKRHQKLDEVHNTQHAVQDRHFREYRMMSSTLPLCVVSLTLVSGVAVGQTAGEGAGGEPESSRVCQSERKSETDVLS